MALLPKPTGRLGTLLSQHIEESREKKAAKTERKTAEATRRREEEAQRAAARDEYRREFEATTQAPKYRNTDDPYTVDTVTKYNEQLKQRYEDSFENFIRQKEFEKWQQTVAKDYAEYGYDPASPELEEVTTRSSKHLKAYQDAGFHLVKEDIVRGSDGYVDTTDHTYHLVRDVGYEKASARKEVREQAYKEQVEKETAEKTELARAEQMRADAQKESTLAAGTRTALAAGARLRGDDEDAVRKLGSQKRESTLTTTMKTLLGLVRK
jgi:hypothetical protein